MYEAMSLKVLVDQRRETMLREAEQNRLKKALRAERRTRSDTSLRASNAGWELTRIGGLIRRFFGVTGRANHNT